MYLISFFNPSGDRLVASGGQNQTYASPHNVQIQLTYPSQGYGAQVTYVAIVVNQVIYFYWIFGVQLKFMKINFVSDIELGSSICRQGWNQPAYDQHRCWSIQYLCIQCFCLYLWHLRNQHNQTFYFFKSHYALVADKKYSNKKNKLI